MNESQKKKENYLLDTKNSPAETLNETQIFLGTKLPNHIRNMLGEEKILKKIMQKEIMKTIDFTPPFLRIEKIIVFGDENNIIGSHSIGMGMLTQKDTAGHYNKTIYLAMCGWLMASAASVHISILYPETAPQVVKADGVMPLQLPTDKKGLWQPSSDGTVFFVETKVKNKKLQLVIAETKISFANVLYGTIRDLKLMLTPKQSILTAKTLPSYACRKG